MGGKILTFHLRIDEESKPMSDNKAAQGLELDKTQLFPENLETQAITDETQDISLAELLVIGDNGLRRIEIFANRNIILLGRFTDDSIFSNHIDLSPFGGHNLGVSRVHAQIQMEGDTIYITDMNSRNGTYIQGTRLEPNRPFILDSGAYITLGRLHLQVMYKAPQMDD
jgi:pSer/pThr/pTyr-binding forkhead associated (FHA) protein